jgi:hypothetical protein
VVDHQIGPPLLSLSHAWRGLPGKGWGTLWVVRVSCGGLGVGLTQCQPYPNVPISQSTERH